MALINLSDVAQVSLSISDESLGQGASISYSYLPDLAGVPTAAIDDIVVVDADSRRLYKGLVKQIRHTLSSEAVTVECDGCENFIDGQVWEAVNLFYNAPEPICYAPRVDQTIQDFFTQEYVGVVTTWFTGYTLPASLADLLLPEMTTARKGFMTCLKEILARYPFANFVIEYSGDDVFPVGQLVLIDTRVARSTHALAVGTASPRVLDFDVTLNASECASTVRIFARGHFVERLEWLQPDWDATQEVVYEENVVVAIPETVDGTSRLPDGHIFIRDLDLFAKEIPVVRPSGVDGHVGASHRIFVGADYIVNTETGEISFLRPEDGADWWWVNGETGTVIKTLGGAVWGLEATLYRRPIAYNNYHMTDGGYFLATQYYHVAEAAYRNYHTEYPIADLRLIRETKQQDGAPVTVLRKSPDVLTLYVPRFVTSRAIYEEDPVKTPNEDGFFGTPSPADYSLWYQVFNNARLQLKTAVAPELLPGIIDVAMPEFLALMMVPYGDAAASRDDIRGFYTETAAGASFEEGTVCVRLSQPQLISIPEWYKKVNDSDTPPLPNMIPDWVTWPILVRYTSWHDIVEERTSLNGLGRVYSGVVNSLIRYDDSTGAVLDTLIDNTPELASYADDFADFMNTPVWEGTATVHIDYDALDGRWVIPYRIGDTITLTGSVSPTLTAFVGLVNGIDYSRMFEGVVTLSFGRRAPRRNPFLPRPAVAADIEDDSFSGPDAGGLQTL